MILPTLLFVIFAGLAATGAYLATVGSRGRRFAALFALFVVVFFVALGAAVVWLIRQGMGSRADSVGEPGAGPRIVLDSGRCRPPAMAEPAGAATGSGAVGDASGFPTLHASEARTLAPVL